MRKSGILLIFICLVGLSFVAPRIDAYNNAFMTARQVYDVPFFVRLLGEGRSILSNYSLLQADLYFHGGAGHFHEEHAEGLAIGEREEHEPHIEHDEMVHEEKHMKASPFNILLRIPEEIEVTEHVHLHDEDEKEIVPWLYYSAKIDPHNVLAYTLTSYWLANRFGKVDEAFSLMRDGMKSNPDSWEISAELGRLYFEFPKDYETSLRYYLRAWKLMKDKPHDKFQERFVLSYIALNYEELGRKDKALSIYRHLNEVFPGAFKKKIEGLR